MPKFTAQLLRRHAIPMTYESRLKAVESDLQKSEHPNKMLMYITGGFALLSTASITFALIR